MLDIENDVFDTVAESLRSTFPGIYVAGEYVNSPPSLPAVTIVEADSMVAKNMSTEYVEDYARVLYEVNVYSNKSVGKKSEAKSIFAAVDEALRKLNFTRTSKTQVPNYADATIYRLNGRYEAIVGHGNIPNTYWIYQNT